MGLGSRARSSILCINELILVIEVQFSTKKLDSCMDKVAQRSQPIMNTTWSSSIIGETREMTLANSALAAT